MQIKDILQGKGTGVMTIGAGRSIHDAIGLLNQHRFGALVVTAEDGAVVGIITERDVLRKCGESCDGRKASQAAEQAACASPVQAVMTQKLIFGAPEDDPNYAMAVMTKNRIRHLPILDEGNLVGMISIGDLVNAHLEEKVFQSGTLKDYISRNSKPV